jgi:hypothetical protein
MNQKMITMKNIFLCLILLCLSIASSAQEYHPLLEIGKTWNVLTVTMADWYTSTYQLGGDTLISGTNYKKLYAENNVNYSQEYLGGIREEPSGQRVFFFDQNETGEGLLYDFSLQPGDTVAVQSNMASKGFQLTFHVDSIDRVTDESGFSRKRLLLSYGSKNFGEEWIEGIGSMQGLISPGNFFYMADFNWESLCTKLDGNVVYYNPLFDTCAIEYLGITENKTDTPGIYFGPNPVTDVSVLQIISDKNDSYTLEIYNLLGVTMRKESFGSNKYLINNREFLPGIYFFKLIDPNLKFETGKFIVR